MSTSSLTPSLLKLMQEEWAQEAMGTLAMLEEEQPELFDKLMQLKEAYFETNFINSKETPVDIDLSRFIDQDNASVDSLCVQVRNLTHGIISKEKANDLAYFLVCSAKIEYLPALVAEGSAIQGIEKVTRPLSFVERTQQEDKGANTSVGI